MGRRPGIVVGWRAGVVRCGPGAAGRLAAYDRMVPADPSRHVFVGTGRPPLIVGGSGSTLITDDGRRILDMAGGALVVNVGHGRDEVTAAMARVTPAAYVVPTWATPERLGVIEALEPWLPDPAWRVLVVSGGSESIDTAMRLARAFQLAAGRPRRWKVVGRIPSYHGVTLATLSVGRHARRRRGYEPLLWDMPAVPWDDADALEAVLAADDEIAAVIAEPVIGSAGGALVTPPDWWRRARAACDAHGVLLIADEVMCGFGRTGTRWGHEAGGIVPDVICGGKGLASGYAPAGAVLASGEVTGAVTASGAELMFFTNSANPVACAASVAVLGILADEDLPGRVGPAGERLRALLADALDGHPAVTGIRGAGLMVGVELAPGLSARRVVAEALRRDVWVYPAGDGEVVDGAVMFGPPFVVTDAELERGVGVLAAALDAAGGTGRG